MKLKTNLRVLVLIACFLTLLMVYNSNYKGILSTEVLNISGIFNASVTESSFKVSYLISTPNCKMLDLNPWDESVKKYLYKPKPLVCSRLPLLSFIEQLDNATYVLNLRKSYFRKYKQRSDHVLHCCYSTITRVTQSLDNYNSSADRSNNVSECMNFEDHVTLSKETEFILVECRSHKNSSGKGKIVYKDMHAVVPILQSVLPKIKKKKDRLENLENEVLKFELESTNSNRLNVIILGIDSISRLNMKRVLPKTLKYVQENQWIELNGYNKIGENTFPNLMAILSGQKMETLQDACRKNRTKKVDDCPTIWKDYSSEDYITLYAEDTPEISSFNFMRTGFVEKPTDYYMRPFMYAAHELLHIKKLYGLPVCVGPVLVVDHLLNYAKRFFRVFKSYNYFTLLWLNSLTHNDVNVPKAMDLSIYKFLNDISETDTYEKSVILLLSDHGIRFGNIRETFIGYMEERLPFMFIWFPSWFREKYPVKYENLLINQNRVTTPFDVYVMLKTLLNEYVESKNMNEDTYDRDQTYQYKNLSIGCPQSTGLFEEQPLERTCADACIDINWCVCPEFRKLNVNKDSSPLSEFIVKYIINITNELVKQEKVKKTICSKWKFLKIFRSQEIIIKDTMTLHAQGDFNQVPTSEYDGSLTDPNTKVFVTVIELNPGRTKFESIVKMFLNTTTNAYGYEFLEEPKRLDAIYKTSSCVKNKPMMLRQYCYCRR